MTHFPGVVLVDPTKLEGRGTSGEGAAFDAVAVLVAPYCENDEWGADGTRYDWFQIGGRFTGMLDGYKPWEDERNYERCRFCEGTGVTTQRVADQYPAYAKHVGKPCIQCAVSYDGEAKPFPGKSMMFGPLPHDGDIVPITHLDFDRMRSVPSVLVTPDGEWHERARYGMFAVELPNEKGEEAKDQDAWAREFSGLIGEHRDKIAILVDFHV